MIDRLILTVVIVLIIFIIYKVTGKFHLLNGILITWAIIYLDSYLDPYYKSYFANEDKTPETTTPTTEKKVDETTTPTTEKKLGGNVRKRPDNLKSPDKKTALHRNDEYDNNTLLETIDNKFYDNFETVIVDGNNFIYALRDVAPIKDMLDTKTYLKYFDKMTEILSKAFNKKNLIIVLKDPETDKQLKDFLTHIGETTIYKAHEKYFKTVFKKYPNLQIVMAYGKPKHRDDYAAIWASDAVAESILLSRDRYRDVDNMKGDGIKLVAYGNDVEKLNKRINQPFTFVTKGVVKDNLIGYTFSKKYKTGFYKKVTGDNSPASNVVFICNSHIVN